MQGVRIENFNYKLLGHKLYTLIRQRYPNMKYENQGENITFIRLRQDQDMPWGEEDEAFWSSLKEEGLIQRWEPLTQVPPKPKRNQAIFTDIGYRVGSGERLTPKQQEHLFTQLINLEARALRAEAAAENERIAAESASDHEQKMVERHNLVVSVLSDLSEELGIEITGDLEGLMSVEDKKSGRVVGRDVPLTEAYRVALRYRLGKQ